MEQGQVAKVTKIPGANEVGPAQKCFVKDKDDRIGMSFDEGMDYIKSLGSRANRLLRTKGSENYLYARESARVVYTIAKKRGAATLAKDPMDINVEILKARAAAGFTGVEAETPVQEDDVDFDSAPTEEDGTK